MATRHNDKTLELKVGLFVLAGLGVLAVLLVQFGRLGEGFQAACSKVPMSCSRERKSGTSPAARAWPNRARASKYLCESSIL
jgi:hypothetical protein